MTESTPNASANQSVESIKSTNYSSESETSRISLGSKSPDLLDFSSGAVKSVRDSLPPRDSSPVKSREDKSEDESELDKVISSAAAAVESFATELDLDDLNNTGGCG